MKRFFTVALLVSTLFQFSARADEGMWIPSLLEAWNSSAMQANGLKLSPEQLYAINKSSLKDAIVHFGGGCTSEIISAEGLLLTNHHCGYGAIQRHSSVENDYLSNGFWAMTREQELANPNLSATLIVRIEDVTKIVLDGVTDEMEESARQEKIAANIDAHEKQTAEGTHYGAKIKAFYYGNEYYMFVTETFTDVRLVGAPPSSIGKFGGDTDNWMWPRHTGDFSVFRIYAGKDNKPAEYSEDNVPYKPKHFLPVNVGGVNEGDFTMIYGFPGRTQEYLTSYAVNYIMNVSNPARIDYREKALAIMDGDMKQSDKVRIQYASKYASTSNYHKKWIGENRGLKKLDALTVKHDFEAKYTKLANSKPHWKERYGGLLPKFKGIYAELEEYNFSRDLFIELVYYGGELPFFASKFRGLVGSAVTGELTDEELAAGKEKLQKQAKRHFKDYNKSTDQKLLSALLPHYAGVVKPAMQADVIALVSGKYKGDYAAYANVVYSKSVLADEATATSYIESLSIKSLKKLAKDPGFMLMESLYSNYFSKVKPEYDRLNAEIERLNRTYLDGIRTMEVKQKIYPDANSTLRIAHGKVEGYHPADAVTYKHYTTLDGIVEKHDPDNDDFVLPERLLELHEKKDYGRYAQNGQIRVCFTASNHTTGGNSGSPVINGKGELIGLNFDRCWEGTMSDIMFDPDRCRNIAVDARYVLFIIDKFAGARHLIDEMKLVN